MHRREVKDAIDREADRQTDKSSRRPKSIRPRAALLRIKQIIARAKQEGREICGDEIAEVYRLAGGGTVS